MKIDYSRNALSRKGRDGDKYIAHVAEGEMIVPPVISDATRSKVMQEMQAAGVSPKTHTVGADMSINPETGLPEFGFLKSIFKPVAHILNAIPGGNALASIALTAAGQPELAAALQTASSLGNGQSLGKSLLNGGLSYAGSALGGNDTIFGNSLSAPISNALSGIGDSVSGALGNIGNATGLSSLYSDASGALGSAKNAVSDALGSAYNGSGLQSAFNSGSDALKSFGLSGSSPTTSSLPVGGGGSSYGGDSLLGDTSLNLPKTSSSYLNSIPAPSSINLTSSLAPSNSGNFLGNITSPSSITSSADNIGSYLGNSSTALNSINPSTGASTVASSSNYFAPLASIGIGSLSNNNAANALLKQANANKALLAPYQNFSFNPGDLTKDPGYQFNIQQGDQALARRQAANGNYFSGAAGKELQDYGQGLADNTYNQAFNRALQTNQTGYNNALGIAGINDSIGNIKASNAINNGNLYSGALGNVLGGNSFTNSGALQGGFDIQSLLRRLGYAA